MLHEIEAGAEFFFSEDDYLNKQPKLKIKTEVKTEVAQSPVPPLLIRLNWTRARG